MAVKYEYKIYDDLRSKLYNYNAEMYFIQKGRWNYSIPH
jgi:hypothetical protein